MCREQSQLGRRARAELFEPGSERRCAVSYGFTTLISESSDPYTTTHTTAYVQALASQESALINNQRTITTRKKLTNSNNKPRFNRNPAPYVLFNKKGLSPIFHYCPQHSVNTWPHVLLFKSNCHNYRGFFLNLASVLDYKYWIVKVVLLLHFIAHLN